MLLNIVITGLAFLFVVYLMLLNLPMSMVKVIRSIWGRIGMALGMTWAGGGSLMLFGFPFWLPQDETSLHVLSVAYVTIVIVASVLLWFVYVPLSLVGEKALTRRASLESTGHEGDANRGDYPTAERR